MTMATARIYTSVLLRGRALDVEVPLTYQIEASNDGFVTKTTLYKGNKRLSGLNDSLLTFDNSTAFLAYRFNMLTSIGANPGLNRCLWGYASVINKDPVVRTFTASGVYTPTLGMKYCNVKIVGGGGGGAGCTAGTAAGLSQGYGAGAGAEAEVILTAAQVGASQPVTIGAGGAGGAAGGAGGAGGTTSIGTLMSMTGGAATTLFGTQVGPHAGQGSAGGVPTVTVGTVVFSKNGNRGINGFGFLNTANNVVSMTGSSGGNSMFGTGGLGSSSFSTILGLSGANGGAGLGFGSGGGGANSAGAGAIARTGGAGAPGKVVITEYFN
jgi:hypothetical protein